MSGPEHGEPQHDLTLRYGGADVTLRRSEALLGVRLQGGAIVPAGVVVQTWDGAPAVLGGFTLVRPAAAGVGIDALLKALRAHPAIEEVTEVWHTGPDEVPFVPTGEALVRFRPEVPSSQATALLGHTGLAFVAARGAQDFLVRAAPAAGSVVRAVQALQASPLVELAEPELATPGLLASFVLPVDELLRDQWHLENVGEHRGTTLGYVAGADARVVAAWRAAGTLGSGDVVVAVIDDGFDLDHPDLGGEGKVVAPRDFGRGGEDPRPDPTRDRHGTACAGVAIGAADGTGVVGAAPGARLMPVRWGAQITDTAIEDWFAWVTDHGAHVVSCSWSSLARIFPLSTRMKEAIHACATAGRGGKGCVVCFSAGNLDADVNDPTDSLNGFATHPDVVAVAASTSTDARAEYSNRGREIWVCAPSGSAAGWGIVTADVSGTFERDGQTYAAGYVDGAYVTTFTGTSAACPVVAGVCALVLTVNPELTAAEVKDVLRATARRIGADTDYDADGHSLWYGYGCVDAEAAVVEAMARRAVPDDGGAEPPEDLRPR